MSVEFSNVYQEILLENLVSIIKQNFVIQTQLKLSEISGKNKEDLEKRLQELTNEYNIVKNEASQVESLRARAEQNTRGQDEANRIQTALNAEMQASLALKNKVSTLEDALKSKDAEIDELKDYIDKLSSIAPSTKLKKLKAPEKIQTDSKIELVVDKPKTLNSLVNAGGTF